MASNEEPKGRGPYNGDGAMKYQLQKIYKSRKNNQTGKSEKKEKDRLRYILKKENGRLLSSAEKKEKKLLLKKMNK